MTNNKFRTPLLQSAVVLGGVIVLALIAASSGTGEGGGFFSFLAGIGNTILFVIGLGFGVCLSIALLVGIFLAAVGMVSPDQAAQMYGDIKKNFFLNLLACSCSEKTDEELNRMKQEIAELQNNNKLLLTKIKELQGTNDLLKAKSTKL